VKTENRSVLRKSRFGSVFDISFRFFNLKPNRRHHKWILIKKYVCMDIINEMNYTLVCVKPLSLGGKGRPTGTDGVLLYGGL